MMLIIYLIVELNILNQVKQYLSVPVLIHLLSKLLNPESIILYLVYFLIKYMYIIYTLNSNPTTSLKKPLNNNIQLPVMRNLEVQ